MKAVLPIAIAAGLLASGWLGWNLHADHIAHSFRDGTFFTHNQGGYVEAVGDHCVYVGLLLDDATLDKYGIGFQESLPIPQDSTNFLKENKLTLLSWGLNKIAMSPNMWAADYVMVFGHYLHGQPISADAKLDFMRKVFHIDRVLTKGEMGPNSFVAIHGGYPPPSACIKGEAT